MKNMTFEIKLLFLKSRFDPKEKSDLRVIRNDKQKDNLAKVFWDMGKVLFTIMVISPFAKSSAVSVKAILIGLLVGVFSLGLGYLLDGMEVQ